MSGGIPILVVDDKPSFRFLLQGYLEAAGYAPACVASGREALAAMDQTPFALVLSDLVMPEMDGVALMRETKRKWPALPFVLVTANGSIDTAVAAMKEGASDYLLKPLNREELLVVIERLLDHAQVRASYEEMLAVERERFSFQNINTCSPVMAGTLAAARLVAASPRTTVAIHGESGVGKEVLARAIHIASGHSLTKLVAVNCAAIPETLLESELFGHVKGAFTGADRDREGKCSRAQGGTLFLDEIGDLPLALQPKLLRLLEERVFEKVGSDRLVPAEFRIIVATHRNLVEACGKGAFRYDLFHRLNVFPITLPPLRERREDIPQLAESFLAQFRQHQGKSLPGLSKAALELLLAHPWPGNVRELRNRLEYAAIVTSGDLIRPEHLRLSPPAGAHSAVPDGGRINLDLSFDREAFSLEAVNAKVLAWALEQCGQNKSSAARLLKTTRKLFY
jgi:DNA-binding NtrC family response regulator